MSFCTWSVQSCPLPPPLLTKLTKGHPLLFVVCELTQLSGGLTVRQEGLQLLLGVETVLHVQHVASRWTMKTEHRTGQQIQHLVCPFPTNTLLTKSWLESTNGDSPFLRILLQTGCLFFLRGITPRPLLETEQIVWSAGTQLAHAVLEGSSSGTHDMQSGYVGLNW